MKKRVWGLVFNFIGNALAIYGAVGIIQDGSRRVWLILGVALTLGCLLYLAKPDTAPDEDSLKFMGGKGDE